MNAVFETLIVVLTLLRVSLVLFLPPISHTYQRHDKDEVKDDSLIELAEACARKCQVLKSRTEGRDTDDLGSPYPNVKIEDLGRCVDPAQSSLLPMTSGIRTVRHIESVINERVNYAQDSPEHHTGFTDERLITWLTKIWEMLKAFDVCSFQPTLPTVSKLPQDFGRGGGLEISEIKQHLQGSANMESSMPAPVMVRCRLVVPIPHSLLTIRSM